jgi:hypothetical protein
MSFWTGLGIVADPVYNLQNFMLGYFTLLPFVHDISPFTFPSMVGTLLFFLLNLINVFD